MAKIVVALYDRLNDARQAIDALDDEGFSRSDIHCHTRQAGLDGQGGDSSEPRDVFNMLNNAGVPKNEAGLYAEGVRRGGTLLHLTADDDKSDEAARIMGRFDIVDIHEREDRWRGEGWKGFDVAAEPYTGGPVTEEQRFEAERTRTQPTAGLKGERHMETGREGARMEVAEEELQVGKREVESGGVRVRSYVTEEPVEEEVRLREEHVDVERRPVDRPLGAGEGDVFREEEIEMRETREEPVVSKRARVIEEVLIGKDVDERVETIHETIRRKDVDIEQTGGGVRAGGEVTSGEAIGGGRQTPYAGYESDFRRHYEDNFAGGEFTYDDYLVAYRYGVNLGTDEALKDQDWSDIKTEVRTQWENRNEGTWDEFKEAIHYGFDRSRHEGLGAERPAPM